METRRVAFSAWSLPLPDRPLTSTPRAGHRNVFLPFRAEVGGARKGGGRRAIRAARDRCNRRDCLLDGRAIRFGNNRGESGAHYAVCVRACESKIRLFVVIIGEIEPSS